MTTGVLTFPQTTIGKKVIMAVSGLIGFGFLLGHMAGNLLVFVGPEAMNEYSATLHGNPALLWATRLVLLGAIVAHVWAAASLWTRNGQARPKTYAQRKDLATNYAALTMRYGGLVLLAFILYHLAHLTGGWTQPLGYEFDPENVYNNVVLGFQVPAVAAFYIFAQACLGLHLYHGLWSLTQTLGGDHPRYNDLRQNAAIAATLLVVLGFLSVPLSVLTGSLQPVGGVEITAAVHN